MDWNKADHERAKVEGWHLVTVIDNGARRPYLMVASLSSIDDRSMLAHVITQAKSGSSLHRRALQAVTLSRLQQKGRS